MARPSKPASVIKLEGKSHRTKKELRNREQAENSLLSGMFWFKNLNLIAFYHFPELRQ